MVKMGKKIINYGNQRKTRNFQISRGILGHNMIKGDSAITVSNINGRPTREFVFKLTSAHLALRVFKPDKGKRVVSWMDPNKLQRPEKVGLVVNQAQAQAQLANPKGKAYLEEDLNSYPSGLSKRLLCDQGRNGLGNTSRLPGVAAESPMVVFAAPMRVK